MLCAFFFGLAPAGASPGDAPCTFAAGTQLRFQLLAPLSSNQNRTGEPFAFVLVDPIEAPGCTIVAEQTQGAGTVFLAGASGMSGHEGDLTLRLDSLRTADGRIVTFDDQRIRINGRNRKIAAGVLGFVPFVGMGAMFIRGSDIHLDANKTIATILLKPATLTDAPASPEPSMAPSPSVSPTP